MPQKTGSICQTSNHSTNNPNRNNVNTSEKNVETKRLAAMALWLCLCPELAWAIAPDATSPFSGVTDFLHSVATLLIMDWGYYIGIITLAIQGYRWKTGRIDLMQLGGWGLGIGLVFFAPNIVADLKSHAGTIT
jgi:type IV secretion system protein VirB2